MPLVKFIPKRPNFAPVQTVRSAANTPPSPGPVLVPIQTSPPPSVGAFSSAFSNAFDI